MTKNPKVKKKDKMANATKFRVRESIMQGEGNRTPHIHCTQREPSLVLGLTIYLQVFVLFLFLFIQLFTFKNIIIIKEKRKK